MSDRIDVVAAIYTGDADEDFLLADVEVAGIPFFQVLKRSENGPVHLAFFNPETREEILVDPESLIGVIRRAVEEIGGLKSEKRNK